MIVDRINEYSSVLVNSAGFHPSTVNVGLGKSVLFDWLDSNKPQNILHVSLPTDKQSAISVIKGPSAFNSGKPVANNKFLHRFDKPGKFCVVTEGSVDSACIIQVLESAHKTETPELVNQEPPVVYKFHKVLLKCNTPNASIHYTSDGTTPTVLSPLYDEDNAAILNEEGIAVVRAIAYSNDCLTSDIFTSQRFYVIPDPADLKPEIYDETLNIQDVMLNFEKF